MIKKKGNRSRRFLLFVLILVSLAGTGVTYTRWSDGLQINLSLSTGIMDIRYSQDLPCYVYLVDRAGNELTEKQEAEAVILDDGKAADIRTALPFSTEEFLEYPDSLIKLEFPIEIGEEGTINGVELLKADFLQEPSEELIMEPVCIALIKEDGQEEYEISEEAVGAFNDPLVFYVFRETTEQNGSVTGVIYLQMAEESRTRVSAFPSEIEISEPGLEDFSHFDGHLMITYGFSVPIYIEQGHQDATRLQETDKQPE